MKQKEDAANPDPLRVGTSLLHPLLFLCKDRKSELDAHLENYGFVPFPAQKTNGIWQPLPLGVDFFHLHLRGL